MRLIEDAIVGCWIVFVAFWAVTALRTKRTVERQDMSARLAHSIPIFAGAWLLLKGTSDPGALGDRVIPHNTPFLIAGLAITLAGLALALWARVTLGTNWSGIVTLKEDHELIRHGPYRHVRHPIYSAILLMVLGSVLATGTLGALLGLPLIGLGIWLKLRQEEELMTAHFPAEYPSYRAQVRALIPGLL
ncbi:MAG TPA: isoprenylcysteine carboxylmethyltransferase family protein [Solirubrobacterales bacterium]|jgi:protein-S-isoprenylcysteine O-methyltransferase Ste14